MLANHKERDTRTTMKGQNRSAALGRPAMELLGGGGGGGAGGGASTSLRSANPALVPQTFSCSVCVEDSTHKLINALS